MRKPLALLGNLCGVVAPLLWAGTIILCGALRPGYSHVRDYISELAEAGSSTATLMRNAGFLATGVMHVVFGAFLAARFRGSALAMLAAALVTVDGVARFGAGWFPCDPGCAPLVASASQQLHTAFARTGFIAMVVAAASWGAFLLGQRRAPALGAASLASGVAAAAFLLRLQSGPTGSAGLWESLASGVLSLWLFAIAVALLRGGLAPAGRPAA